MYIVYIISECSLWLQQWSLDFHFLHSLHCRITQSLYCWEMSSGRWKSWTIHEPELWNIKQDCRDQEVEQLYVQRNNGVFHTFSSVHLVQVEKKKKVFFYLIQFFSHQTCHKTNMQTYGSHEFILHHECYTDHSLPARCINTSPLWCHREFRKTDFSWAGLHTSYVTTSTVRNSTRRGIW